MRVIARKECPHPGAQLRFTDIDEHRVTCFATSTRTGQLPNLKLRHRRRAPCEDRIRCAKSTGLRNLPLHGYDQNEICCEIVVLACELLARKAMLTLTGARRWEPKRLPHLQLRRADRPRKPPPAPVSPVALDTPTSLPPSAASRPQHRAHQTTTVPRPGRRNTRVSGTPPTRRDSHGHALKTTAAVTSGRRSRITKDRG